MEPLTIAFAYYKNKKTLEHHLGIFSSFSAQIKNLLRVIVVDDGSPQGSAIDCIGNSHIDFDLKIYRIGVNIPWNMDGARNLAMSELNTPWAILLDMDHFIEEAQFVKALSRPKLLGEFYMPQRRKINGEKFPPHANQYLLSKKDFWEAGGYDEDFAGFYGSDSNFKKCLRAVAKQVEVEDFFVTQAETTDRNTKDWGRKNTSFHAPNNPSLLAKRKGPAYKAQNPLRFPWRLEYNSTSRST